MTAVNRNPVVMSLGSGTLIARRGMSELLRSMMQHESKIEIYHSRSLHDNVRRNLSGYLLDKTSVPLPIRKLHE